MEDQPQFQLEDAIEILERRKWWIVVGSLVGLALGGGLTFALPPKFESTTTIMVEPQRVPEAYVRSTVTLEVEQRVDGLQERVTSYASLNKLIDEIGEVRIDPSGTLSREKLMNNIREGLDVTFANERNRAAIFEISYVSPDPALTAEIVRRVAALYIDENVRDRAQQATATAEFLDRELERLREDVSRQEQEIQRFRGERMGSLPSQLETNLRSLDRLNLELGANIETQVAAGQRIALLRQQAGGIGGGPVFGMSATLLKDARERLLRAEGIYTSEHPDVIHLREEVERLEREMRESPETSGASSDPLVQGLQREVEAAQLELDAKKRREKSIREEIAEFQARVEKTPQREQELLTLTRDYNNLTETYRTLLGKKYEAAIARNLEQAQKGERFKVLRPAHVPTRPSWPDPLILLPAGLGFGLAIAGLCIFISELRNPAFRSVERLTRMIGLPVFASIPRIDRDAIYEVPPDGAVDPKLVVFTAPESAPAQQYRNFLPFILAAENCKIILVTSAARGDGKSLTCMNLAISLATDLNKRVLVIDSDLRRPSAHRLVRIPRVSGLSDILTGRATIEDCAVNSKIPNLMVLPAGNLIGNPLALLTGKRFLELLAQVREQHDLIMIDSPPLLPVVDTRILRTIADMVLFVVRADGTPRKAAVRSLQEMKGAAGVVFNEVSPGSFRRHYYYDAYARYAYGDAPAGEDDETSAVLDEESRHS
jgi:succinoglycan biosynthesis transport protein ExoP